ncbi:MAG: glycosyltransferase [Pseudomonadota bacterium]
MSLTGQSFRPLIIGKRNGILHWFEDVLAELPTSTQHFAINDFGLTGRILKHWSGADSARYQKCVAAALATTLASARPSHVFVVDRFYLSAEVNAVLAQCGARTAQWAGDRFDERLAQNTGIQDFFFTDTGLLQAGLDMGLSSHYLPLAAHKPTVALLPWQQRTSELLFVGAPSPSRIALLEGIRHPVRVIGPKWPALRNPQVTTLNKRLSLHEVRQLYARHRFVLNQINSGNLVCGLPARCFDATAHGACLITDEVIDLALNFKPGLEVLVYSHVEQLNEHLQAAINAPELAETIALAGQERSLNEHLFSHRLAQMLSTIS